MKHKIAAAHTYKEKKAVANGNGEVCPLCLKWIRSGYLLSSHTCDMVVHTDAMQDEEEADSLLLNLSTGQTSHPQVQVIDLTDRPKTVTIHISFGGSEYNGRTECSVEVLVTDTFHKVILKLRRHSIIPIFTTHLYCVEEGSPDRIIEVDGERKIEEEICHSLNFMIFLKREIV